MAKEKEPVVDILDRPEAYRAVAPDKRSLAIGSLTFDEISKANRASYAAAATT